MAAFDERRFIRDESERALELWRRMNLVRCVEERIADRYAEQRMRCPTHLSVGQEAVASGVSLALEKDDQVVSGHRAHAHYLAKGGDPGRMLAEIYGKKTGCSRGKGGSMHLVDGSVGFLGSTAIVGNTIPIGVGAGLSNRLLGNGRVSCIFFGDAAVEEGVFYEAANFAVLHRLPVLFVCENNLYSVYSPLRVRQPEGRQIWELAGALGLHAAQNDGNNVFAVFEAARRAVSGLREGEGPAFLEFTTYRWREHCGPNYDNDLGYRSEEEFQQWKARDPVEHARRLLIETGGVDPAVLARAVEEIIEQVDKAFEFAETSDFPEPSEAFTDLFAEQPEPHDL